MHVLVVVSSALEHIMSALLLNRPPVSSDVFLPSFCLVTRLPGYQVGYQVLIWLHARLLLSYKAFVWLPGFNLVTC